MADGLTKEWELTYREGCLPHLKFLDIITFIIIVNTNAILDIRLYAILLLRICLKIEYLLEHLGMSLICF